MKIEDIKNVVESNKIESTDISNEVGVDVPINTTNVVNGEKLRKVQSKTLKETREFLSKTFGPMGSNTKIIKGQNQTDINSSYSKDGLKVLENIINSAPIEASIVDELISVTRAVEKEVGDGTTSSVILSSFIFDRLKKLQEKYNLPPFKLCRLFQEVVTDISNNIDKDSRECTVDDIYNISMISTNGNNEVSENIKNIYEKYGMDVELSTGISNNSNSVLKVYDGLTITEGMSDPAYINNTTDNTCEIRNARIYHFADPIDTMGQVALFEAILSHNIYEKYNNDEQPIPTVITCPKLTGDISATIKRLIEMLYQFGNGNESLKPPILVITNVIASDEIIMDDIANLCGCKTIHKYIDKEIYASEVEKGIAPTVDNISEFGGYAELVVSDKKKTKFINPKHMQENDSKYTAMVNFLETEIESAKDTENAHEVGLLKRRLSALKANMVDYLVGGVTIAERDMIKDLVEDAIKNCKSASLYGVGYAANFEGLSNSYKIYESYEYGIKKDIAELIFLSYVDTVSILYGTVELDDKVVKEYIYNSIIEGKPYDISKGYLPEDIKDTSSNVLCSIKLDIQILETVTKIITMMETTNQALLMSSTVNLY